MKNILISISLFLASCLVVFLVTEIGVRILLPHEKDHVIPGQLFEIDEILGWRLKSDWKSVHKTRYFTVTYNTNSQGFRDIPRVKKKPDGMYRILQYGDSQVFGWGVPVGARFSNELEANAADLEVWNLGVPAYGLDQQILAYERDGADIEADEVMFFVSYSTLSRAETDFIYGKPKPVFWFISDGKLTVKPPSGTTRTRLVYEMFGALYLPYFLQRKLRTLKERWTSDRETVIQDAKVGAERKQRSWELLEGMLKRVQQTSIDRRQKLSLLSAVNGRTKTQLSAFAKEQHIDLVSVQIDLQVNDTIFGEQDRHWTAKTHRLVAEQIRDHWVVNRAGGPRPEPSANELSDPAF